MAPWHNTRIMLWVLINYINNINNTNCTKKANAVKATDDMKKQPHWTLQPKCRCQWHMGPGIYAANPIIKPMATQYLLNSKRINYYKALELTGVRSNRLDQIRDALKRH